MGNAPVAPGKAPAPKAPNPAVMAAATPGVVPPAVPAEAKKVTTKTEVTTVKMTDGRAVDFPGKRKLIKESFEAADGTLSVRLDFSNGETRTVKLRNEMIPKYALHGAEQKLGDEIAGIDDVDDCVVAVDELVERLDAGEWTQKRDSSGMAGASVLIKALVEFKDVAVEKVKAFLKTKSPAYKTALRASTSPNAKGVSIKAIVDRLEAEKAAKAKPVDIGDAMSELDKI